MMAFLHGSTAVASRTGYDRGLHAEEAIEGAFETLALKAEIMGWTRDEAAFALLNLAAARVLTIDANRSTDEAIARAVDLVHGRS